MPLVHDGKVLAQIIRGIYSLPQTGHIVYDKLEIHLVKGGYVPTGHTPGLFKHYTHPIYFCIVVDDFGVKYINCDNAKHLIQHLSTAYKYTIDWDGKIFLGIHLDWDYNKRTVDLSIPNYINRVRKVLGHKDPILPKHNPHPYTAPQYNKVPQMVNNPIIEPLTKAQRKITQTFCSLFQYYARSIDTTMLSTISSIVTNMTTAT